MSSMPALRRKTAGAFAMLLCAAPMAKPSLAQPVAAAPSQPPGGVPLSLPPPQVAKPPEAGKAPAPAPRSTAGQPDTASPATPLPAPVTPPAAAAAKEPTPGSPAPAPSATAAAPTGAQDRTAAAKPAKPEQKSKPGPGANDAGHAADLLRTMKMSLVSLIDRTVIGKDKIVIGHVIDVLVDAKGEPAALVVDAGGILGVGNRRIAIAWERFALAGRKPKDALQLPMTDAQVKSAPAYDGSDAVTVVQGASEPAPIHAGRSPDSPAPATLAPGSPPASGSDKPSVPAPVPPRPPAADPSRVDLGTSPAQPADDQAPIADPLNPD